jgi:DNA-binding response OmpR family regulator
MSAGERRRTGRSQEELQLQRRRLQREWHIRQRNRRVLFVSGLPDEQTLYRWQLERCGFQVAVESSPPPAFDAALRCQPAVVIVDYSIDGDCLDLVRKLRADRRTDAAYVVMLSSHVRAQDRVAAEHAGTDLFLTKPCLPDVMTREIAAWLQAD